MKSERDREKTDGGTGGRTGRQAGRKKKERKKERKKENNERTYRSTCCFPDTKGKTKDRKGHEV